MSKLILLFALISCLAQARDVTGKWNGMPHAHGIELRLIFQIARHDSTYEYASIDQTIDPVVFEEISGWVLTQTK